MCTYNHYACIDMLALLYSKLVNNSDIVDTNTIDQFDRVLRKKLKEDYDVTRTSFEDQPQQVYNLLTDSNGKSYAVFKPRYFNKENLPEIWEEHLSFQSESLIMASIDKEALTTLGINQTDNILDFFKAVGFQSTDDKLSKPKQLTITK